MIDSTDAILSQIESREVTSEPEFRYKVGMIVHNLEALLSAVELWKVTENDNYLNAIIMQFNETGKLINRIISEGFFDIDFIQPMRQLPLPEVENPSQFLLDLLNVKGQIRG